MDGLGNIYIYLRIYDIYDIYIFFLIQDIKPVSRGNRPSDFRSDDLSTELASLTQGSFSTVDAYTRSDIEAHKFVPGYIYKYIYIYIYIYIYLNIFVFRLYKIYTCIYMYWAPIKHVKGIARCCRGTPYL